jgi:hypothetical protein
MPRKGCSRPCCRSSPATGPATTTSGGSRPGCWTTTPTATSTAAAAAAGRLPPVVSLPVAFTVFTGGIFRAPRSWAERVYPNLVYLNEVDRGGHFAAWEEPQLFTDELRAAFRSLR